MWLELFQVKVSFNWQALMLVTECLLFLSTFGQVCSLKVRHLNLVSFFASVKTPQKWWRGCYSVSVVIAVQLVSVFHRGVL
ncbi:hypothetical protein CTT30_06750 [Vibrio coralliilyticus]|nr:hypothetical protein CTT30_06750 [Vibrio coralliilyticus]